MREFTRSQIAEHLKWVYSRPGYYKEDKVCMREAGTIRERIYQALVKRYTADQEEALVKIDALLIGEVLPGHEDIYW